MTSLLPLAKAEWGTVPDWVTAFGTLAAFAVALRLLAKELAERRREQARRVAAWTLPAGRVPKVSHVLVMHNGSEEPVYEITLEMEHPDEPGTVLRVDFWDYHPPEERSKEVGEASGFAGPITLSFTDAAGRRWKRYPNGRLVEMGMQRCRSRKDYMNAWIVGELDRLDY